jgi:hypothetical protein
LGSLRCGVIAHRLFNIVEWVHFSQPENYVINAHTHENIALTVPPDEIESLLESPVHEVRVGAVSIMDWQARSKKTSESRRKELYNLYIRRHDRINRWDLVDRSAPYVVGSYLSDKPRDILDKLASSKDIWERRTAIVSTYYLLGKAMLTTPLASLRFWLTTTRT